MRKKISIIAAAFMLCFAFATQAQVPGPYFGIRFMPTVSKFDVKQVDGGVYKTKAVIGYGGGAYLGFNLSEHVGLQGEVLYSPLSQKYTDEFNIERKIDLNYVNVPLLLVLNTGVSNPVNLNLVVGPQIGINVGSNVETTGTPTDGVDTVAAVLAVKSGDLGVAYGAGIDFNLSPVLALDLGFRGVYGLIDISEKSQSTTTEQYYLLDRAHVQTYSGYIGMRFKF